MSNKSTAYGSQNAQNPQKSQSNKPSTHQFVICAINIETATNRKFLQAFTNKDCEPLRFDSVNDCVLYLAKIGATSAEIDAGTFKFVNFSHVLQHGDQTGRIFDYDSDWFLPRTDIHSELVEGFNAFWKFQLLNVADYKPYCSDGLCLKKGKFSVEHMQFKCACGRIENDDPEFLKTYGKVWAMPWALEQDN